MAFVSASCVIPFCGNFCIFHFEGFVFLVGVIVAANICCFAVDVEAIGGRLQRRLCIGEFVVNCISVCYDVLKMR